MLSLASESGFQEERKLLQEVFEAEQRPDGGYFVYTYDQRYYKVLSACAKLRLRTRNLPEGNPSYIEVATVDWEAIFGNADAPVLAEQSNVLPLRPETAVAMPVEHVAVEDDEATEFNIEQAVEDLAKATHTKASHFTNTTNAFQETTPEPSLEQRKTVTMEAVDLEQRQKETYRARTEALQSREEAINSREEAVRSREDAAKNREGSIGALEREIAASEATFIEKEKDIKKLPLFEETFFKCKKKRFPEFPKPIKAIFNFINTYSNK
jgi:hypothetical protein